MLSDIVTFVIPKPPSVNKLWRSPPGSRRPIKSKEYRDWLEAAGWEIRAQQVPLTPGRVEVSLVYGAQGRRRDLDNNLKATLDLLTAQGVIEDDSMVARLTAEWGAADGCIVTIRPAGKDLYDAKRDGAVSYEEALAGMRARRLPTYG